MSFLVFYFLERKVEKNRQIVPLTKNISALTSNVRFLGDSLLYISRHAHRAVQFQDVYWVLFYMLFVRQADSKYKPGRGCQMF